jgi:hypothetical protein
MGSIHPSVCRVRRAIVEDHETHHEIHHGPGYGTFPPTLRERCTRTVRAPST